MVSEGFRDFDDLHFNNNAKLQKHKKTKNGFTGMLLREI